MDTSSSSSSKPVENPVHVVKCFGGLNVIGCQKIDGKSNGEPDDVWAEEEEGARDKGSHPAWPAAGTISKKCKILWLIDDHSLLIKKYRSANNLQIKYGESGDVDETNILKKNHYILYICTSIIHTTLNIDYISFYLGATKGSWDVIPGFFPLSTQAGVSKNDPEGPVPAKPAGNQQDFPPEPFSAGILDGSPIMD